MTYCVKFTMFYPIVDIYDVYDVLSVFSFLTISASGEQIQFSNCANSGIFTLMLSADQCALS